MNLKENNPDLQESDKTNILSKAKTNINQIKQELPSGLEKESGVFVATHSLRPAKSLKRKSWIPRPIVTK